MSLTDRAYTLIRREIISCALPPGQEFTEVDLAARLEMSKTPVREALARLQFEGLVRAYPRRGYQIEPIRVSDIDDIFDARIVLEAGAIAMAVPRISAVEMDRLEALAAASSDEDYSRDLEHSHRVNNDFHEAIAQASGNERLHRMIMQTNKELERFFFLEARADSSYPADHMTHSQIVAVMRTGDALRSRAAISEHIENTRLVLIGSLTNDRIKRSLLVG